jgi:cytochrome c553
MTRAQVQNSRECPTCHHREQTKAATYRFKRLAGVEQDSTEEPSTPSREDQ